MKFASNRFLSTVLVCAVAGSFAQAAFKERTAEAILKDLEAVKKPNRATVRDQKSYDAYREALTKRSELIGELLKADAKNEKLEELLPERWSALMMDPSKQKELEAEVAAAAKTAKSDKLKAEIGFQKAVVPLRQSNGEFEKIPDAVSEFATKFPKDERAAQLLYSCASQLSSTEAKLAAFKDMIKNFPDSQYAAMAKGTLKQVEAIGKPFELSFKEAITGKEMSMKDLKGTVVVVDFWATWCGPCVAEMPKMKSLYAEYKPKGVEFIGVSLDQPEAQGGLTKLKDFVKKNEIGWPQYYQGNFWNSEFSKGWGVNAIPCVFVVDADGNLFSTDARGKLETILPELLKKAKPTGEAAGGN